MDKCNDFHELQLYNILAKWNQKGEKYEEINDKILTPPRLAHISLRE